MVAIIHVKGKNIVVEDYPFVFDDKIMCYDWTDGKCNYYMMGVHKAVRYLDQATSLEDAKIKYPELFI